MVPSIDFQSRVNDVPRRVAHAVCTIYVHRISFELRAQGSVLYAKRIGRVVTLLVREQPFRHSTSLRRGRAVAEPWSEGNRLWLWWRSRMRRTEWTKLKKRKTIDPACRMLKEGTTAYKSTDIARLHHPSLSASFASLDGALPSTSYTNVARGPFPPGRLQSTYPLHRARPMPHAMNARGFANNSLFKPSSTASFQPRASPAQDARWRGKNSRIFVHSCGFRV